MLALRVAPQVESSKAEFQALGPGVLFTVTLTWAVVKPNARTRTLWLGREVCAIVPTTIRVVARGDISSVRSLLLDVKCTPVTALLFVSI